MPRLDRASLRELEAPYRNVPLNPALDVRPESKKGFLSGPWGEALPPEAAAPAGPSNPFAALVPQAPAPPAPPAPAPPQALAPPAGPSNPFAALVPQAPPAPALLGSNPVEAAKNAEIAQRLQSQ